MEDPTKDPYRNNKKGDSSNTVTPTKVAICAKCRHKTVKQKVLYYVDYVEVSSSCQGDDEFCLADYGGKHPLTGKRSPVLRVEHKKGDDKPTWTPLKHAVLCQERNPSGRCDRFVSSSWIMRLWNRLWEGDKNG